MSYIVKKSNGPRPYKIIDRTSRRIVGSSTSRTKANRSISYREEAEDIATKSKSGSSSRRIKRTSETPKTGYKRKVDNKMRVYGETDFGKGVIRVNKKMSKDSPTHKRPVNKHASKYPEVLDTIVHEEMHAAHPKMHERTVRTNTRSAMNTLSKKEKLAFYGRYR